MGVFEIVIISVSAFLMGALIRETIHCATELHLLYKDIKEIKDKLESNRREREVLEQIIKDIKEQSRRNDGDHR